MKREKMFKLRFYHISGEDEGNLWKEEYFYTKEEMHARYREVWRQELYTLNPTAWKRIDDNDWERLLNY